MMNASEPFDYAAYADEVAEFNRQYLLLDFTPASVTALDTFITEMWGEEGASPATESWKAPEGKWKIIHNFGIYFGEVLRRRFGGSWVRDENEPNNMLMVRLEIPDSLSVYPVAKVWKRFKNGIEDSIAPLLREIRRRKGDSAGPDEWREWLTQANWFKGVNRPDHAIPFFEQALAAPLPDDVRKEVEKELQTAREVRSKESVRKEEEPPPPVEEGPPDFVGAAEIMARSLTYSGIVANYSPASIAGADLLVNAAVGREPATEETRAKYPSLEWELGSYIGEVFCRRYGGRWHAASPFDIPADDPLCYHIIWPSGFMTCPFVHVSKRLENGARYSLHAQLDLCRKVLLERGDIVSAQDDPKEWFEQGYILGINKKSPAQGAAFLKVALKLDPNHVDSLHWLARLSPDTPEGKAQALQLYDRAIAADPAHQPSWLAKVLLLFSSGRKDSGGAVLRQAVERLPEDPELNELLGEQLLAEKDLTGAAAAFEKGTRRGDSARSWEGLGLCRKAWGDLDGAIEALRQAADRDRERASACFRLAGALEQRGDKLEALEWYRKGEERHPDEKLLVRLRERIGALENDPVLMKIRAERLADDGDMAGAVAMYERAASLNPTDVEAWREAGVGYALLEQFEKAMTCFDRGLAVDPADILTWDHKAVTLGRMGKAGVAVDILDQGLMQRMDAAALWSRRSYFLCKLNRFKEAIANADKALSLDPDNGKPYLFKADAERMLGKTVESLESLGRHIAWVHPRDPKKGLEVMRMQWEWANPGKKIEAETAEQLQGYAFQHWQQGDGQNALRTFEAALEADPFNFEIWGNYGCALAGLGMPDRAVVCFERAHALYPLVTMFLQNKARALTQLFRNEEALACHEQILKMYAANEESLAERARLLHLLERWEEALEAALAYASACPDRPESHRRVAWELQGLGRNEEALAAVDRAIALRPEDRNLWLHKSAILGDLGQEDAALELQTKAFADEQFAEQYHQEGLSLLDAMIGKT